MKEYRLVKGNENKCYRNDTGEVMFSFEYRGFFRKKYHFIKDDTIIGYAKKKFMRNTWIIKTQNNVYGIFRKPIIGNQKCYIDGEEYNLTKLGNKLEFKHWDTMNLVFTINPRLISKDSIIIENNEYYDELITVMVAAVAILKNNLVE